ncbi:hypothetical protein GCM10027515_05420 [Schumannella luteola]|uniref:Uncharacterized protein n=1 Tax=Schumannella luteola TaxID=472059 RepID=A0A852YAL7_9MICO|nr:hypothetical protein [Schumannella luteola]NYG98324.1 hypothetical protein [Schumannella luteola]TPX05753.1 hypothetical protein FJ656_04810 [Schumannella luteola]
MSDEAPVGSAAPQAIRQRWKPGPWQLGWLAIIVGTADLVIVGIFIPGAYEWFGSWFFPWVTSPGFGGFAAVIAAAIAFAAARHQSASQRQAERKEQWWKRAEWALNLTLSGESAIREVGYETLGSLSTSEYAAVHEADIISAATNRSLAAYQGSIELAGAGAGAASAASADVGDSQVQADNGTHEREEYRDDRHREPDRS